MPAYEEIANEFEMQIVSLSEEYKKLITKMSTQREDIHREVDNVFNQMDDDIDEIKEQHISHGFEGDIPEYQPRGDTKVLARYVTRCRRQRVT